MKRQLEVCSIRPKVKNSDDRLILDGMSSRIGAHTDQKASAGLAASRTLMSTGINRLSSGLGLWVFSGDVPVLWRASWGSKSSSVWTI
jgi:hypothetical protein